MSFFSWQDIPHSALLAAINSHSPALRAWHVEDRPRAFHATFAASWRRYVYLFPLREAGWTAAAAADSMAAAGNGEDTCEDFAAVDAADVNVEALQDMLQQFSGRTLECYAYARDTPRGKECTCTIHRAHASVAELPPDGDDTDAPPQRVLVIELVANRFLRKMVRVLVATALRESVAGAGRCGGAPDALVRLADGGKREHTASPGPGIGLIFAGAGYDGRPPPGSE